ncbi:MAG: TIGR00730 family Rossman fold protein [Muribaculaceae bacterium]|nr:TIGR00730 family Rossman fold protein [Muribaculaceae bacterium]
MRIAVYCSARPNIPACFHEDARSFGKWIGDNGHTLVYGGLRYSMMRDVAQAAADAGAKVMGIVPESRIADQHPANTVSLLVPDLHERKQMMEENADVFVALEGGIGTLDEVFSALASSTFFKQPKEIHLLDRDGLYAPLRQLLEKMEQTGLATPPATEMLHFHPDLESLTDSLTQLSKNL